MECDIIHHYKMIDPDHVRNTVRSSRFTSLDTMRSCRQTSPDTIRQYERVVQLNLKMRLQFDAGPE